MIINNLNGVINVKKVLAIDDSTVWRNFLQNLLEIKGYNVETAKDGLDGINKFFTFLPDVVIVDYVMPKLNGIHFTRFIRSFSFSKNVGIIMLTGADETVNKFWAKKSGVNYFLKKTLPQDELEKEVLEFVNKPFAMEWSREIYKIHIEPYGELVDIIEESLKESTLVREIMSYSEFIYDERLVVNKLFELFSEVLNFKAMYMSICSLSEMRLYGFGENLASPEELHSFIENFTGIRYYSSVKAYFDGNRKIKDNFVIEIIYQKGEPVGFLVVEEPSSHEVVQHVLSIVNEPIGALIGLINDYNNLSSGKEIDEVTGLYNKTYFRTRLLNALDFVQRNNLPASLGKLTIKNLREISTKHGEDATNNLLKKIGNVFLEKFQEFSARFSANEFVCIFIGEDIERAKLEIEECKKNVQKIAQSENIKIDFDCKVVEWHGETIGELIEKLT